MHDSPWLLNFLVNHNSLGEGLLDWSHLDLLLHFGVFNLLDDGLESGLLLVGVLVLDGLGLLGNVFCGASTVGLALAGALTSTTSGTSLVVDLIEIRELGRSFVHDVLFTPGVEIIMREEPVEFIALISSLDKVGSIDNVLT